MPKSLVKLNTPDGRPYFLWVDPTEDAFQAGAATNGMVDGTFTLLWNLTKPGDVILDLGANIGTICIPLAVKGAHTYAFEILDSNADALEAASAASAVLVTVIRAAAWSSDCELSIAGGSAWGHIVDESNVKVSAIAVDGYVDNAHIDKVDLIKIDVEGAELQALAGLARTISNHSPDIVFESNVLCLGGKYSCHEIMACLEGFGYKIYRISENLLHPFKTNDLQDVIYCDYLASKRGVDVLSEKTGFAVRPITRGDLVQSILLQDAYPDVHKIFTFDTIPSMPFFVRFDPRVIRMRRKWRPLAMSSGKLRQELLNGSRKVQSVHFKSTVTD